MAVLDYGSGYTHCMAVGNKRLPATTVDAVWLRMPVNCRRGHDLGEPAARWCVTALAGTGFVNRLRELLCPSEFNRIRPCGLLVGSNTIYPHAGRCHGRDLTLHSALNGRGGGSVKRGSQDATSFVRPDSDCGRVR